MVKTLFTPVKGGNQGRGGGLGVVAAGHMHVMKEWFAIFGGENSQELNYH